MFYQKCSPRPHAKPNVFVFSSRRGLQNSRSAAEIFSEPGMCLSSKGETGKELHLKSGVRCKQSWETGRPTFFNDGIYS